MTEGAGGHGRLTGFRDKFQPSLWVRQPLEGKLFARKNYMTTYEMLQGLI